MATRAKPRLPEAAWQQQVTDLAGLYGWDWLHVEQRVVTRQRAGAAPVTYAETPTKGTLGRGWVDLLLIRGERVLFVELKADDGRMSVDQKAIRDRLRDHGQEWHRWCPRDLEEVKAVLAR